MRDVLVLANRYDPFDGAVPYGALWARRLQGMLSGLHIVEPAIPSVSPDPAALGVALMAEAQRELARAREAAPRFAQVRDDHAVEHGEWHAVLGPDSPVIAAFGHWHDLLVFEGPQDAGSISIARAGGILLASGKPCIVVPPRSIPADAIDRIVIAWNGSAESIRALRAARPLFAHARRLTVLVGRNAHESWVPMPEAFSLDAWARREGLTLEHYPLEVPDARSGEEILSVATQMDADLLVMGAYGRSRFNEWLVGGATRHALAQSRIPLFMMH